MKKLLVQTMILMFLILLSSSITKATNTMKQDGGDVVLIDKNGKIEHVLVLPKDYILDEADSTSPLIISIYDQTGNAIFTIETYELAIEIPLIGLGNNQYTLIARVGEYIFSKKSI